MALSIAVELPVAVAIGWSAVPPSQRWRLFVVAVAATLVTHPFAWETNWRLSPHLGPVPRLALVEIAVAAAEAVFYTWAAGLGLRRGVVASVAANATSFGVGLMLL